MPFSIAICVAHLSVRIVHKANDLISCDAGRFAIKTDKIYYRNDRILDGYRDSQYLGTLKHAKT